MTPETKKTIVTYAKVAILCGLFYWPNKFDVGMNKIPFYILSWIIIIISVSAYGIVYWELNWRRIILYGSLSLIGVAILKIIIDYLILSTAHDLILLELLIVFITGSVIAGLGIVVGAIFKRFTELPPE